MVCKGRGGGKSLDQSFEKERVGEKYPLIEKREVPRITKTPFR